MDTPHRPLAAALWMSGSIVGFCAIAISGREISPDLDTFEMMLYRSVIGFAIILGWVLIAGRRSEISTRRLDLQLLRNLVHFAGQNLWLYALLLIPMAQLFALEFSSPIIVALVAPFLLGERLTPVRLLTAVLGFAGILIVARPFGAGGLSVGLLVAIASAVSFAGAAILTKMLTRIVPVLNILFWLTLMQTGFALVCAGWDFDIALPTARALPWVFVMGVGGIVAHLSLTKALSLAPATIVTPIDFLRLPLIAVVGMLFYAEPFDRWVLIGGAVIFVANWINLRAETRATRSQIKIS
ncbi:MAG TPA: DMT family transporter [Albidovulum sp.]|uniref:DMT family transporter n=1 Tax=Albidovulum sp. TaxID=1872424 RepID=UPI002B5D2E1F|nr:DMT family transporter [Albidovulum sp.]